MPEHHTSEYAYFFEHLAPEGFEGPSSSPNHSVAFDKRRQQLAGSPVQHAGVLEPEDEPEEDVVPWIGDLWDDELSHSEQGSDPLTADLLDDEDVAGFTESDVEDFDDASSLDIDEEFTEEFGEALAAGADDQFYTIKARRVPGGNIFQACRVGDAARVQGCIDEGADVNARDLWDSVPLYYACKTGHLEVARTLLQAGASCNEYTFDGERCHYVSLYRAIRDLLSMYAPEVWLRYAQRPPPLTPLAEAIRRLCPLASDAEQAPGTEAELLQGLYSDLAFIVHGRHLDLHRLFLSAGSPVFHRRLLHRWAHQVQATVAGQTRRITLDKAELSPAALDAVLGFMYTERLDINTEDVDAVLQIEVGLMCTERLDTRFKGVVAVLQVARASGMLALEKAVRDELRTLKYHFKTVKQESKGGPKRFMLNPSALPPEARLAAGLSRARRKSSLFEKRGVLTAAPDFADVILEVDGRPFRCHRCILAARSDFLGALLEQPLKKREGHMTHAALTEHEQQPRSPGTFWQNAYLPSEDCSASERSNSTLTSSATEPASSSHRAESESSSEPLPILCLGGLTSAAFALALEFIYTDRIERLQEDFLSADGAAELFAAADQLIVFSMKRRVAEELITDLSKRPLQPSQAEHLCRLVLVAERFSVDLLRQHCLRQLALLFERITAPGCPPRPRAVFESWVMEVAPEQTSDVSLLLEEDLLRMGIRTDEDTGPRGTGSGSLLQDLREEFLQEFGGSQDRRDRRAAAFDTRLKHVAERALRPA